MSLINPTSGAWLLAGMSHPSFLLSPFEFMAAMCRRNSTYNTSIPEFNSHGTSEISKITNVYVTVQPK